MRGKKILAWTLVSLVGTAGVMTAGYYAINAMFPPDLGKIATERIEDLSQRLETVKAQLKECQVERNSAISDRDKAQNDLQNVNQELAKVKDERDKLQEQLIILTAERDSLKDDIKALQSEIASKDSQISTLNAEKFMLEKNIAEQDTKIAELNSKVVELQNQLAEYAGSYKPADDENIIMVTFEVNGQFYEAHLIQKNTKLTYVTNPVSEDYTFNYWEVDGEQIDLSSYTFTDNTNVVANISTGFADVFSKESPYPGFETWLKGNNTKDIVDLISYYYSPENRNITLVLKLKESSTNVGKVQVCVVSDVDSYIPFLTLAENFKQYNHLPSSKIYTYLGAVIQDSYSANTLFDEPVPFKYVMVYTNTNLISDSETGAQTTEIQFSLCYDTGTELLTTPDTKITVDGNVQSGNLYYQSVVDYLVQQGKLEKV